MHRGNMLLVKEVIHFTEEMAVCHAIPDGAAWYADPGHCAMPGWVGIELMAQTIAAHVALLARRDGRPPRPGALLGTRHYQSEVATFPAGSSLLIEVRQTFRNAEGLASYECVILSEGRAALASAALTVFEPSDFETFISGVED